jgi:hypothetical protein
MSHHRPAYAHGQCEHTAHVQGSGMDRQASYLRQAINRVQPSVQAGADPARLMLAVRNDKSRRHCLAHVMRVLAGCGRQHMPQDTTLL